VTVTAHTVPIQAIAGLAAEEKIVAPPERALANGRPLFVVFFLGVIAVVTK